VASEADESERVMSDTKAIRLVRLGPDTLVEVEYAPGKFVVVIRERFDAAFSHIVEPSTIDRLVGNARQDDDR